MKKVSMGLVHLVFMVVIVLFVIVTFSSCNAIGYVSLNEKDLVIEKLRGIQIPKEICIKSDTNNLEIGKVDTSGNIELTGDFRFDNLFK